MLMFCWCWVKILKMKFDQDLCLNLQYDFGKMNSTLGSVVPLAMFIDYHWSSLIIIDHHWLSLIIINYLKIGKSMTCSPTDNLKSRDEKVFTSHRNYFHLSVSPQKVKGIRRNWVRRVKIWHKSQNMTKCQI